jgi:hypothetical protein
LSSDIESLNYAPLKERKPTVISVRKPNAATDPQTKRDRIWAKPAQPQERKPKRGQKSIYRNNIKKHHVHINVNTVLVKELIYYLVFLARLSDIAT